MKARNLTPLFRIAAGSLFMMAALLLACSRKITSPQLQSHNHPPFAPTEPAPEPGAAGQDIYLILRWSCADPDTGDTLKCDVFLDTLNPPITALARNQPYFNYAPRELNGKRTYFWKVVVRDNFGAETPGPVWSFTTGATPNHPPSSPVMLNPPNGSTKQKTNLTLVWLGGGSRSR